MICATTASARRFGDISWRSCSVPASSGPGNAGGIWDWQDLRTIWISAVPAITASRPKEASVLFPDGFAGNIRGGRGSSVSLRSILDKVSFSAPPDFSAWNRQMRCLSWWLAGFAVLCTGWNQKTIFFICTANRSPGNLLQNIALPRQSRSFRQQVPALPTQASVPLSELFPLSARRHLYRKPLNKCSRQRPASFILEDVTGAGKTEAAFCSCTA